MTLTPKQLSLLSTKDDLKDLEYRLEAKFDKKLDKILNVLDVMTKEMKTYREEQTANVASHDRFEKRIITLEKKMDRVEAKLVKSK